MTNCVFSFVLFAATRKNDAAAFWFVFFFVGVGVGVGFLFLLCQEKTVVCCQCLAAEAVVALDRVGE